MARAVSIWLIMSDVEVPLAAFTVKHECQTWIDRYPTPQRLTVLRMKDNPVRPDIGVLSSSPSKNVTKEFIKDAQ